MKKLFYIMGFFFIYYFAVVAFNGAIDLGNWVSQGNVWLLYGYYGLLAIIFLIFFIRPLVVYFSIPSLMYVARLREKNRKPRAILKHLLKTADEGEKSAYHAILPKDTAAYWVWIENCMENDLKSFDAIIGKYAKKTTISVMISPNSFIDGLIILISNINMLSELSQKLRLRANVKESIRVLFGILSFSSIMGLYEEFDEVIEEAVEEIIEEFTEIFAQGAPTEIIGNIPGLSILPKLISPILQGASNFSFIYYIGFGFKNTISAYVSQGEKIDQDAIKKTARKQARKMKRVFVTNALKELSSKSAKQTGKAFGSLVTSIKNWNKPSTNENNE